MMGISYDFSVTVLLSRTGKLGSLIWESPFWHYYLLKKMELFGPISVIKFYFPFLGL